MSEKLCPHCGGQTDNHLAAPGGGQNDPGIVGSIAAPEPGQGDIAGRTNSDGNEGQTDIPLDATTPVRGPRQTDAKSWEPGPHEHPVEMTDGIAAAGGHDHPAKMTLSADSTSARQRVSERVILDLCSGSGSWSQPYADAGYTVMRFELNDGRDVRAVQTGQLRGKVHGILAAPPCRHFSRAGAPHWKAKGEPALLEAVSVLDACLRIIWLCRPQWWALENPVGRIIDYIGQPAFKFHPWEYGDGYTKNTWLWGEFKIPDKQQVAPLQKWRERFRHDEENRAVTPPGFAQAFFNANP